MEDNNMKEILYGFIDEDNKAFDIAVLIEGDTETLETLKQLKNAVNAYPIIDNRQLQPFPAMYWDNENNRWSYDSPYPSWIWNEELYIWESPIPYPIIEEGSDEIYVWDETTISWLLLPPSN